MSVYQNCAEDFDFESQLEGLIQCLSTAHEEVRNYVHTFYFEFCNISKILLSLQGDATTIERIESLAEGVDTFYLIFAGALVYFMQTGFAMLCAGSIRAKNVKNVILWNLLDSCGGGLAFWATGYAFAYGGDDDGPKTFIGNTNFFLRDDDTNYESWFFQFAFACALSSIVAGTIAERTKMTAYLLYSVFLTGFVYPVVRYVENYNFSICFPNPNFFISGCACILVYQWVPIQHCH